MQPAHVKKNRTAEHASRSSRLPVRFACAGAATATLAISLGEDGAPPTEFRLFVKGWNETENGRFLFDDAAAKATMAAYKAWGVDLMIDLEHQSLDPETPPEPTAKDARGWCNIELRADGSLWAVNVKWTPDGVARLTERRQRYVSPAFGFDADRRVTQLINVAITAMPATHDTPALMAASTSRIAKMAASGDLNPKLVSAALDAVAAKDAKGGLTVLQQILAALLGGSSADPDAGTEDAPPAAGGDGGKDETTETAGADPEKKKDAMAAVSRVAIALTGKADAGEAMAELTRRSKVAVELEAREAKLAADQKVLEAGARRELVASLVKLGVEIPATAWSDDKGTEPCARLAAEPIADLRARVQKLTAAGKGKPGATLAVTPPAGGPGAVDAHGLDARELGICKEMGCEPATFAMLKARRDAANTAT